VIVYLDSEWVEDADASISIHDRGFLFADGVFETALLYNGVYFRLREHLDRLRASAALMGIATPDVETLESLAAQIAQRNNLSEGSLRITISAGPRDDQPGTTLITIAPRDAAWVERAARGWSVITANTRRPSTAAVPAQLKALGRTYALIARREARIARVDDALLLTDDGFVCEGPSWNVFWRRGTRFFTPALELGVLAGVTRGMLLRSAASLGYEVTDGAYERSTLDDADEIFASMTSVGIARIRVLDGRVLPTQTPAADALFRLYWEDVHRECSQGRE
jgi:branched-subunit amino acid aminotransferase/4-amino-4-deoxychorismate lyase